MTARRGFLGVAAGRAWGLALCSTRCLAPLMGLALLLAIPGQGVAQPPTSDALAVPRAIRPGQVRRVFVPVNEPARWPRGDFVPWPATAFETWYSQAGGEGLNARRSGLVRQIYRARLEGQAWVDGQFVWIPEPHARALSLESPGLVVSNLRQGDELVPYGADAAGVLRVYPLASGSPIKGQWEPGELAPMATAGWSLWRWPSAPATRLELTVPRGLRVSARGAEVRSLASGEDRSLVWSIEAGAARELVIVVAPETARPESPALLRYTAETAFNLRPEATRFQCDLFVTASRDCSRTLRVYVPEGLTIDQVSLRDQTIPGRAAQAAGPSTGLPQGASAGGLTAAQADGRGTWIEVPVELSAGIPTGPIRVRGGRSGSAGEPLPLPIPEIEEAEFLDGSLVVRTEPPFQIGDVERQGLRLAAISGRSGEGDVLTARQTTRNAALVVSPFVTDLIAEVDLWTLLRFEAQVVTAEAVVNWRSVSGSTFTLKCGLPPGWEVTDVRSEGETSPGEVSQWRFDDTTGTLRVELLSPLATGSAKRLRLSARYAGDATTAPVTALRLITPGAASGSNWCVVADNQFRVPAFATVSESGLARRELPAVALPPAWNELPLSREPLRSGEQLTGAARLPTDGTITEVRMSAPRRPIEAAARMSYREEGETVLEELTLTLTPLQQVFDRFVVSGFAPDSEWSWTLMSPRGLDVQIEPLPALTEAEGQRFAIQLSEAVGSPIGLVATRKNPERVPRLLSLPVVEEVRAFRGRVVLTGPVAEWSAYRPQTRGEQSRADLVRSAVTEPGAGWSWDYARGAGLGEWVRDASGSVTTQPKTALVQSGTVHLRAGLENQHVVELEILGLPSGPGDWLFRLPEQIERVKLSGAATAEPVASAEGSGPDTTWRLRLAGTYRAGESLVLRYSSPATARGQVWSEAVALPVWEQPVASTRLEIDCPPQWALARSGAWLGWLGQGWQRIELPDQLPDVGPSGQSSVLPSVLSSALPITRLSPVLPAARISGTDLTRTVWVADGGPSELALPVYDRLWAFHAGHLTLVLVVCLGVWLRLRAGLATKRRALIWIIAGGLLAGWAGEPIGGFVRMIWLGAGLAVLIPAHWLRIPRPLLESSDSELAKAALAGSTRSFQAVAVRVIAVGTLATLTQWPTVSPAQPAPIPPGTAATPTPSAAASGALTAPGTPAPETTVDVLIPVDAQGRPAISADGRQALVYLPPALVKTLEQFRRDRLEAPSLLTTDTQVRLGAITGGRLAVTLTVDLALRRDLPVAVARIPWGNYELDPDRPCLVDGVRRDVLPFPDRRELVIELPPGDLPEPDSPNDLPAYVTRRIELAVRVDPQSEGDFLLPMPTAARHSLRAPTGWNIAWETPTRDLRADPSRNTLQAATGNTTGDVTIQAAEVVEWRVRPDRPGESAPVREPWRVSAETFVAVRAAMTDVTVRCTLDRPADGQPRPLGWRLPSGWRLLEARSGGKILAELRGLDEGRETWWMIPGESLGNDPAAGRAEPVPLLVELVCQAPSSLELPEGLLLEALHWLPLGPLAEVAQPPRVAVRAVAGLEPAVSGPGLELAVPLPSETWTGLAPGNELRAVEAYRVPATSRLSVRTRTVDPVVSGNSRADILWGTGVGRVRFTVEIDEPDGGTLAYRAALSPGVKVRSVTVFDGLVDRVLRWSQQGEQLRILLTDRPVRRQLLTIQAEFDVGPQGVARALPLCVWTGQRVQPTTVTLYHAPTTRIASTEALTPVDAPFPRTFPEAVVYGTFADAGADARVILAEAPLERTADSLAERSPQRDRTAAQATTVAPLEPTSSALPGRWRGRWHVAGVGPDGRWQGDTFGLLEGDLWPVETATPTSARLIEIRVDGQPIRIEADRVVLPPRQPGRAVRLVRIRWGVPQVTSQFGGWWDLPERPVGDDLFLARGELVYLPAQGAGVRTARLEALARLPGAVESAAAGAAGSADSQPVPTADRSPQLTTTLERLLGKGGERVAGSANAVPRETRTAIDPAEADLALLLSGLASAEGVVTASAKRIAYLGPTGVHWLLAIGAALLTGWLSQSRAVCGVLTWLQGRTWRGATVFALALIVSGLAPALGFVVATVLGLYGLLSELSARWERPTVVLTR
jgi:hypothetical protein